MHNFLVLHAAGPILRIRRLQFVELIVRPRGIVAVGLVPAAGRPLPGGAGEVHADVPAALEERLRSAAGAVPLTAYNCAAIRQLISASLKELLQRNCGWEGETSDPGVNELRSRMPGVHTNRQSCLGCGKEDSLFRAEATEKPATWRKRYLSLFSYWNRGCWTDE
jgi:hypothetical protein